MIFLKRLIYKTTDKNRTTYITVDSIKYFNKQLKTIKIKYLVNYTHTHTRNREIKSPTKKLNCN